MSKAFSHAQSISPRPRLAAARFDRGWSQQEMADQLGTTPLNISRWERGLTTPGPYFKRQLQLLFGLSTDELAILLGDEYPVTSPVQDDKEREMSTPASSALYDPGIPLPVSLLPLIGRDEELNHCKDRLLTSQWVALSALHGLPGVGKTALAVALAYDEEIREHFADGVLWAWLGPQPDLAGLLARWGYLLGVSEGDARQITTLERWRTLLRGLIGERRMLIVLDDAWNLEDALACQVGGIGCGYVLTTRQPQLALRFAQKTYVVSELDEQQSLDLLQRLAPETIVLEKEQVQALISAVGGLPLALVLIGNALRIQGYSGQSRRIRSTLAALQSAETRLQLSDLLPGGLTPALPDAHISLQAVLEVSEQHLSARARSALFSLSVLPAKPESFGEQAALAVCQQPVEVLDELCDSGLLESVGPERYTLHQVISDHARLQLSDPAPIARLIAYSVEYTQQHAQDYTALEQENSLLQWALDACNSQGQKQDLLALTLTLAPYWQARGAYSLIEEHLPSALSITQAHSLPQEQIRLLLLMGDVEYQRGNYRQAQQLYEQALPLCIQTGAHEQECAALAGLGLVFVRQARYQQSVDIVQKGLTLARQQGYLKQQATLLYALTLGVGPHHTFEQKLKYAQDGLALAQQVRDDELACHLLIMLGSLTWGLQANPPTISYTQQALALARQRGYRHCECHALVALAFIMRGSRELQQARSYAQEALTLARHMTILDRIIFALAVQADIAFDQGEYKQATKGYQEALSVAHQIGIREIELALVNNLSQTWLHQGDYQQAERYMTQSLEMGTQLGVPVALASPLIALGTPSYERGAYETAESYLQRALEQKIPEGVQLSARLHLGVLELARGAYEQSIQYLLAVEEESRSVDIRHFYDAQLALAEAMLALSNIKQAEQYLQDIQDSTGAQDRVIRCKMFVLWGELYLKRQQHKQAQTAFEQALALCPTGARPLEAIIHFGQARVATACGDLSRARQLGEISATRLEKIGHRRASEMRAWVDELKLQGGR